LKEFNLKSYCGRWDGDKLLRYLPTIINPHLREIDYLARTGGDEFGLIFEDIHNKNDMLKIFDRILSAFSEPIQPFK